MILYIRNCNFVDIDGILKPFILKFIWFREYAIGNIETNPGGCAFGWIRMMLINLEHPNK